jgi:hypothetical protein
MTSLEIWNYVIDKKYNALVNVTGKTPWQTINAQIYVDMRDNENSKFLKVGKHPTKFFLKDFNITDENIKSLPQEIKLNKQKYNERDLHKVLTYYAYTFMHLYTKTIYHEKSKRKEKGANEWLHPDIVGYYFPLKDWEKQVLDFSANTGSTPVRLYSFEMKKELDFANIRAAFFQAVSNSSWANEGYLVASNISEDMEFLDEIKRLSASFGIGIIKIDINSPDDSKIIFPAKYKSELDWDTINKICDENPDFQEFLSDINASIVSKKIYNAAYDKVYALEELIDEFK